jgi:glycerate kinase
VNLFDRIQRADLVITGEGQLDFTSYDGKVVGSVIDLCTSLGKPAAGIFGNINLDDEADQSFSRPNPCISISANYGIDKAIREPLWCIEHAALDMLRAQLQA